MATMASDAIPPPLTTASETVDWSDQHEHRRRFIGPLPERVVAEELQKSRRRWKGKAKQTATSPASSDCSGEHRVRNAIHNSHAYQFFLKHGGLADDWSPMEESRVRAEMARRWGESEWAQMRRRPQRSNSAWSATDWVGKSFDVGVFLGVNLLAGDTFARGPSPEPEPEATTVTHRTVDSFVTAPSLAEPSTTQLNGASLASLRGGGTEHGYAAFSQKFLGDDQEFARPISATSTTPLLEHSPQLRDGPTQANAAKTSLRSDHKGKGKVVHYSDEQEEATTEVHEHPVPPKEVLSRHGQEVQDTSAGAAEQATVENQVKWGDVIMRDRMLVRVSYSERPLPSADFDESRNRITRHLEPEAWSEFIVVWRKDRLELYKDHKTPGKDWLVGHKQCQYVIPLDASVARLSLYSFVDLTFSFICPPASLRRKKGGRKVHVGRRGSYVYIFKHKARTRAADWLWQLWRHLGGQLPPTVDILAPTLDTRIIIDVPHYGGADLTSAYAVFSRRNLLRLCLARLKTLHEYESVFRQRMRAGAELELAWRSGTNLDWVWQMQDVRGAPREWDVLYGLALAFSRHSAHLELRLQEHFPTRLHLRDGTRLDEPSAVEGYVARIRPNSQLKQHVYLVTHGGYLFALTRQNADHPLPLGLAEGGESSDDPEELRKREAKRGTRQILNAMGVTDLRSIVAVRRAFQVLPQRGLEPPAKGGVDAEDAPEFWEDVERTDSDDEDAGGEKGLAGAQDRSRRKMRRSFELLMSTGAVVRFETQACQVALEWIVRLRPLVSYWRKRHCADARTEMDINHLSSGHLRITPQRYVDKHSDNPPEPIPHPDVSLPELSTYFNWCVLNGCRSLLKCGKLWTRSGLRGQYRQTLLVLVSGHLVQYSITDSPSMHHRRYKVVDLFDTYVCSGYLAAQYLPEGEYDPNAAPTARRYADGLEADDADEDTLLMVWYRKTGVSPGGQDGEAIPVKVPSLGSKRRVEVFRTRSKLERDSWVWAIDSEIEKVVRGAKEWEDKVRETGGLLNT